MRRSKTVLVWVSILAFAAMGCQTMPREGRVATPAGDMAPVTAMGEDAAVREWLVVGPFPDAESSEQLADGSFRRGFGRDYLRAQGGESAAIITGATAVAYEDEAGAAQTAEAQPLEADPKGIVPLGKHFVGADSKVAYAFAYVESPRAEATQAFFGSDDWAKVWVNGELVHTVWKEGGRRCQPREEHFAVELRKGLNAVLVKVENIEGPWGFIFEVPAADEAARILAERERREALLAFQDVEVGPRERHRFLLKPGPFPEIVWRDPEAVKRAMGDVPLRVRWFDGDLNEVASAKETGRYAAYIEGRAEDGRTIRRALTFFCAAPGFLPPWWFALRAEVPYLKNPSIEGGVWEEQARAVGEFAGAQFIDGLRSEEDGAILLAGLAESEVSGRQPTQLDEPLMRHQDYHLALKRRLLGVEGAYPELKPPRRKSGRPATVLRAGTPEEAGMTGDAPDRIRGACRQWCGESGEPFTVLVARHGVVFFHEPFGGTGEEPITLDTRFPMASLTKAHAGLLFAQFLDQGLIGVDDPVGTYLPDFPVEGDQVVTLRHCFTHTTGLEGHGEWGGMKNPWLDNVIANGLEVLKPGGIAIYNGMGFDLGGKVMEMVSGKSIFRLFQEHFFVPLGQDNPTISDLGFGIQCTVEDLARVGQLMLNRGSYGDMELFSPERFEVLMPRPYKEVFPGLPDSKWDYGLGITWMRDKAPGAGENGIPKDQTILSRNTIAHGAASSTVLRVDLDNELVVAMCRFRADEDYGAHLARFLEAIADSLE